MKKAFTLLFSLLCGTSVALAKDIKTTIFTTTPQMHCINCETKIKKNLRFVKGIKDITTSVPNQTVTIKYDANKTSVATILEAFKKIGYDARTVKEGEKVAADGSASKCKM